ncbi:P-loop containing nucleoside triphosphate hydrolase protein [Rhizophagus irregularis]|uniref:RNA helicase n=3 Tax=Rhizophagus irregularis TaxID=588596 RepID=A0A2N0QA18_9GLOM|nr:putative helicase [Rhizophagus irregularis DAOM 197198w]PKC15941.1 P-loop containing nucleoside triphosphate hydrolase protein [Rhizophagus irregularis]UZO26527.1 hypothetical protein OCT59_018745 [Rhizophagus irregularis]GBC34565.2 P-loop containing nucleoside triphosphate hydrolase protein [Rhizophagus irregularis DAOM 181602=DAOM 197198]
MPPKTKTKKKKQINSARAFSTTSTPSKNKETLKNEIESQVSSPISEPSTTELVVSSEQTKVDNVEENINEEETYINSIIENYQDLDLKRVDAYFKDSQELISLGNEMQVLKLDSNIEHKILNFIKKLGYHELDQYRNLYTSNLSQEHIISSLNKLYLILLRLGFSQENIKECLININGAEVKAALDWLCIHLSSEDLPAGFVDKIYYEKGMNISVTRSTSPTSQSPIKKGDVFKEKKSLVQNSSSTSKPKRSNMVEKDMKDWILNSLENDASDDSELEPVSTYQPLSSSLKYATLKCELVLQNKISSVLKKFNRSQEKQEQVNQRIDELQKEIKSFEELGSYEFNSDEAEMEFKNLMKDKDLEKEVKEILGDEIEDGKEQDKTIQIDENKQLEGDQKKDIMEKINDDDDDDLFGGLLDNVPDDSTTSSESNVSSTIIMREMIPKTFTGKLPKDQLKEFCRKKDDKVKISFDVDRGGSHYKCSLKIRWSNEKKGQDKEWNMGNVACRKKIEAESYVATLALFELTDLPIYLTFPTFFRELWLELTEEKKSAENKIKLAEEQERIKLLIDVIEEKKKENIIEEKSKISDELDQEQIYKEDKSSIKHYNIVNKTSSEGEAMKKAFLNRQKNKTYMDMLEKRKQLPIYSYKDQFLEKLNKNQVVIISGETGCGKSTQIPQFITEDMLMNGYGDKCNVICTQPRRISAISIAYRVSAEIGDLPRTIGTSKALVGYQIRLESKVARGNILTFCTYGILLRRLESDKLLKDVSHVIIDEVHERSLESDFLMIILKKIFERRSDLKVILMSATIEASKISRYFDHCPIIEIPGKIFPVEVKFLEDVIEETDYMIEADDEFARKVHRQIRDEGTITITGKGQTSHNIRLQYEEDIDSSYDLNIPQEYLEQYSKKTQLALSRIDETCINYDLIISLLNYICNNPVAKQKNNIPEDGAILIFLPGMAEIRRLNDQILSDINFSDTTKFLVYPLHSTISSEDQNLVFDIPPKGVRKIVLATNIAETGITIPDVTIVVDTGKVNQIRYNERKKITNLQEMFISKANAKQRKGRAGRIREGICFHLFTKWKYEREMHEHELPEILRLPLQELCLKIKICELGNIEQVLSMALDVPLSQSIKNAIITLQEVQAITAEEELTPLGIHLSHIPVDVHLGKMILFGSIFKCLDPILTISAILNYKSPFLIPFGSESEAEIVIKNKFKEGESDLLTMYKGYILWKELYEKEVINKGGKGWETVRRFCVNNFLSLQNLLMIEDIKKQFLELLVNIGFVKIDESSKNYLSRYRFQKSRLLCAIPSYYNQNSNSYAIINATILAGLYPKIIYQEPLKNQYFTVMDSGILTSGSSGIIKVNPKNVFIHPSSIVFKHDLKSQAKERNWFIYNTLIQTTKLYVRDVSKVDVVNLVLFGRDIEIKHEHKMVIIDKWIVLQCPGKTSTILKYLRHQLNKILKYKIDYPTRDLEKEQEDWLNLILEVIKCSSNNTTTLSSSL